MFHTYKTDPEHVPPASPDMVYWFVDQNGMPKYKDEAGVLRDFKGDKGEKGERGVQGRDGLGGLPVGSYIVGDANKTYQGFLKLDGSQIDPAVYPDLVPFCIKKTGISGGTMVPNNVIQPTASSFIDVRTPNRAFDGVLYEGDAGWHSSYEYHPWIQAYFSDESRAVNAIRIYGRRDGFNIGSSGFKIMGSHDGLDFTIISNFIGNYYVPNGDFRDFMIETPGNYRYYRIQSYEYYYQVIGELQFYVDAKISELYFLKKSEDLAWMPSGYSWFIKY